MAALDAHFSAWFDSLELKVIGPTKILAERKTKLCASSLKVGVHFAYRPAVPDGTLRRVKEEIKSSVKSLQQLRCEDVIKNSIKCEYKIYENSARLLSNDKHHSKRIKNEAVLRYNGNDVRLRKSKGMLRAHYCV